MHCIVADLSLIKIYSSSQDSSLDFLLKKSFLKFDYLWHFKNASGYVYIQRLAVRRQSVVHGSRSVINSMIACLRVKAVVVQSQRHHAGEYPSEYSYKWKHRSWNWLIFSNNNHSYLAYLTFSKNLNVSAVSIPTLTWYNSESLFDFDIILIFTNV